MVDSSIEFLEPCLDLGRGLRAFRRRFHVVVHDILRTIHETALLITRDGIAILVLHNLLLFYVTDDSWTWSSSSTSC